MTYVNVIISACAVFPLITLIFTIPYMIYEYHKFGSINVLRVLIVYSFILYLLIAYFLIILPLPSLDSVKNMTGPYCQLIPLSFIVDIIKNVPISINFYKYQQIYQPFFNLVLTIPFGMYLRYYFKQNVKQVVIYSFMLSLFFEITQLTGLYFIYPRPYRLFDVDDLLLNTLGGVLGFYLSKLFMKILPTREEIDLDSYKDGQKISVMKRLMVKCIDLFFVFLVIIFVSIIASICKIGQYGWVELIVSLIIYYVVIPSFSKKHYGQTISGKILNIKIVNDNNEDCKWYQFLIRYFFLFLLGIGIPFVIIVFFSIIYKSINRMFAIMYILLIFVVFIIFCIYIFIDKTIKKRKYFYEKISKTKLISTIKIPDEIKESID